MTEDQKPYSKYDVLQCSTKQVLPKSSAQVETTVRPLAVRPKAGELKLGRERPYRLMGRFSEQERDFVIGKAQANFLSVNEFIRASVLGNGYVSSLDPVKRELLRRISQELGSQGETLHRVAEHMGLERVDPQEGNSMLAVITRSLLSTHTDVRRAMTEGMKMD
jgi:hypothetical protein